MANNLLFPGCVKEYQKWDEDYTKLRGKFDPHQDNKSVKKELEDLLNKEMIPVLQKDCKQLASKKLGKNFGDLGIFDKLFPGIVELVKSARNEKQLAKYLNDSDPRRTWEKEFGENNRLIPTSEDLNAIVAICQVVELKNIIK